MASDITGLDHNLGTYRFRWSDNGRKAVSLGKNIDQAESMARLIQTVVAKSHTTEPLTPKEARAVSELPKKVHAKIAGYGYLRQRRVNTLGPAVDQFLQEWYERAEKPQTVDAARPKLRSLISFFDADKALSDITVADMGRWHRNACGHLAPATQGGYAKAARHFFDAMIDEEIIQANPARKLKTTQPPNQERAVEVPMEDSIAILEACPDPMWRCLWTLTRWLGLRGPSELEPLCWSDVFLERNRLRVTVPKLERHQNSKHRYPPLFPEVRQALLEYQEWLPEGASNRMFPAELFKRNKCEYELAKIIRRAGLTPWKKPFTNVRQTRANEVYEQYGERKEQLWIGHDPATFKRSYARITDAEYAEAAEVFDQSFDQQAEAAGHTRLQAPR